MLQRSSRGAAQIRVEETRAASASVEASQARERARARLVVEGDLSRLDASHFLSYDGNESCSRNAGKAFDHFVGQSNLGVELTTAELAAYRVRFLDELDFDCKHDPHVIKHWLIDVKVAVQHEKPVMTQALADILNAASLSFSVAMKEWMVHESAKTYSERLGKHATPEEQATVTEQTKEFYSKKRSTPQLPSSFDARAAWPQCAAVIGRIHNQGLCGSCWAFGALSAADSRICIVTGGGFNSSRAQLSRGYVTSCATQNGCNGGLARSAYNLLKAGGVPTGGPGGCKPYWGTGQGTDHFVSGQTAPPCPRECEVGFRRPLGNDKFAAPGFGNFREIWPTNAQGNADAKLSMMRGGPLSFGIFANDPFLGYSGGIFSSGCGSSPNHEVVAIGWGAGHFIGLNSWGPAWGENGAFKVADCAVTDWTIPGDIRNDVSAFPLPLPGEQAAPSPAPAASTTLAPAPSHPFPVSGPCLRDAAGCITSPNFPGPYGNSERCVIGSGIGRLQVEAFDTEAEYDSMRINGLKYHGSAGPHDVVPQTNIVWSTDDKIVAGGWRLCPDILAPAGPPTPAPAPAPTPVPKPWWSWFW